MNEEFQIKQLVAALNDASCLYYAKGESNISDAKWDEMFDELKKLEEETGIILSNSPTQKVGSSILPEQKEVKHNHAMMSLNKCHSAPEVLEFANGRKVLGMIKYDGLTVTIKYVDGKLVSAETRGDGEKGSDCTEHVKQFKNVPLSIRKDGVYVIDGEAIIFKDDFDIINQNDEFKNPRNTAAGTLSVLDTSIVKDRRLSFIAWDVIEGSESNSLHDRLVEARNLGFDTADCIVLKPENLNIKNIEYANNQIRGSAIKRGIPIDGVVYKFDDIAYGKSLGRTGHHFKNGIAYKFGNEEVETQLIDIEWSMGKVGDLTPVAIFKPIELYGTTVERASIHNLSIMHDLIGETPYVGQVIKVTKANEIIPQITWGDKLNGPYNASQYLYVPDVCPICGEKTVVKYSNNTKTLECSNAFCGGKLLGKLSYAASKKALDIDGLSEATLQYLVEKGFVSSIADIYKIVNNPEIIFIWKKTPGFGAKSVDNLIEAINKSRTTTLDRVITAMSIPNIGSTAAKAIAKFCNDDLDAFGRHVTGNPNIFLNIEGFGEKSLKSLDSWALNYWIDFLNLCAELTIVKPESKIGESLAGLNFVITGDVHIFKNRDAFKKYVEDNGGKVAGSVSKKTSYLIINDLESTTSKAVKARQLGVPLISEDEFVEKFGNE